MRKHRLVFYVLHIAMAICVVMLLAQMFWQPEKPHDADPDKTHFALIGPVGEDTDGCVREAAEVLAEEYRLDLEFHEFSTVAEQKRMLRLLSQTDVDGVLLWPISTNAPDYAEELLALKAEDVPVVVVDRNVGQGICNSFIGSGTSSEMVVLNQNLEMLGKPDSFAIGNLSGGDRNSLVAELVFFTKAEKPTIDIDQIRDGKLCEMVQTPPDGYQASDYLQLTGKDAQFLSLKYELIRVFADENSPKLFFSLDSDLSEMAALAKARLLSEGDSLHLLCCGSRAQHQDSLDQGVINGLVTSRPEVSVTIGIRYLRDICRGFWVPATMDSGIDYLVVSDT